MGVEKRPKQLSAVQALSAVGQCRLIALWDELFQHMNQPIAQILLTRMDIADRTQYLNAANTLNELLSMGVIPIVNENDTVSVSEIRFGDNDTLSALTAGMVNADFLFLMTDVDSLYTDNPRINPDAKPVEVVEDIGELRTRISVASSGSSLGTGGMETKLIAAELATGAGVTAIITRASRPGNILAILDYLKQQSRPATPTTTTLDNKMPAPPHTRFLPKPDPMKDRQWWIRHGLHSAGSVVIDEGAWKGIAGPDRGSLFAAGVVDVKGTFGAQQAVQIIVRKKAPDDQWEMEIVGKGIANYTSVEISRIKGCRSSDIERILGYVDVSNVIHRDSLVVFQRL